MQAGSASIPGVGDHAEVVQRFTSGERDMTPCQMNVRVPKSMVKMLDDRRAALSEQTGVKISRDEWIRRVIEWALIQPPGTPVRQRIRRARVVRP